MIRWLIIALFIFLILRLIRGPKNRRRPAFRFHFGNFQNSAHNRQRRGSKQKLEEIEEAEFEDITEKVNKENNS